MVKPFAIPVTPQELEGDSSEFVRVQELEGDVTAICQDAIFQLKSKDATCINDTDILDAIYTSSKNFKDLAGPLRTELVQVICHGARELSAQHTDLTSTDQGGLDKAIQQLYRNAVQEYGFFLSWLTTSCIATQAQDDQEERSSAADQGKKKARKPAVGAKGKGKAAAPYRWDCCECLEKTACAGAVVMSMDLLAIFTTHAEASRLVNTLAEMATNVLAVAEIAKKCSSTTFVLAHAGPALSSCFSILSGVASRPDMVASVAESLMELARREEHAVHCVVQAAVWAETRTPGAVGLARALVIVFASTDPSVYDEQAAGAAGTVKQAAEVVAGLSDQENLPKVVASHLALLLPYLACGTASVRSNIVHALFNALAFVYGQKEAGDERDQVGRAVSKKVVTEILMHRMLDKSAHVRVKVVKGWGLLASNASHAFDLSRWPLVLECVFDRLSDDSVLVQKEALKTLQALVEAAHNSAFGNLNGSAVSTLLQSAQAELKKLTGGMAQDLPEGQVWAGGDALEAGEAAMAVDGAEEEAGTQGQEGQGGLPEGTEAQLEHLLQPTQQEAVLPDSMKDVVKLRAWISRLETNLEFTRCIQEQLSTVEKLLSTPSTDVVKEAINLIKLLEQYKVPNTDRMLRSMWSCIFSREEGVRCAVVDAMYNLYLKDWRDEAGVLHGADHHALSLVRLIPDVGLGETAALEEVLRHLCVSPAESGESVDWELAPEVLMALVKLADKLFRRAAAASRLQGTQQEEEAAEKAAGALLDLRASLFLIGLIAPYQAKHLLPHVGHVMTWLKGCVKDLKDGWCVRQCCLIIKAVGPQLVASDKAAGPGRQHMVQDACGALAWVMGLDLLGHAWYGAAETAMAAVYYLHPYPHDVMDDVLQKRLQAVLGAAAPGQNVLLDADGQEGLARCMFLAGHCAINHLALVDRAVKETRAERTLRERLASQAQERASSAPGGASSKAAAEDDLALVGGSSTSNADAALDTLRDVVDAQILEPSSQLKGIAILAAHLCHKSNHAMLKDNETLCGCVLLAVSKFMLVDKDFCEDNMQLLVEWMTNTALAPKTRCDVIVALADLAVRYPNVVEPWTRYLYEPLKDNELRVRRTCLTVLSHLTLNDMLKVKGHIASVALCLLDANEGMRDWTQRFFTTLSQRSSGGKGGSNPIYNLLSDILSALSHEAGLSHEGYKEIMQFLLTFVKDSKQCDAFKEKLCLRMEALHETEAATAADFTAAAAADREQQRAADAAAAAAAAVAEAAAAGPQVEVKAEPGTEEEAGAAEATDGAAAAAQAMSGVEEGGPASTGFVTAMSDAGTGQEVDAGAVDSGLHVKEEVMEDAGAGAGAGPVRGGAQPAQAAEGLQGPAAMEQDAAAGVPAQQAGQQPAAPAGSEGQQPAAGGTGRRVSKEVAECRNLACVLQWLGYTEKGQRRLMELLKCYKHTLGDKEVFNTFWSLADHAKRHGDKKTDIRDVATKYMAEIQEIHKALRLGTAGADEEEEEGVEGQHVSDADQEAGAGSGAEGEQEQPRQSATAGRSRATAATRSTGSRSTGSRASKAAAPGAKKATGRGASSRPRSTRRDDDDDDDDNVVDDSSDDDDEVVGPPRRSKAPVAAPVSKGKSKGKKAAASQHDEEADVEEGRDQGGDSDEGGASLDTQVKAMSRLKVSGGGGGGGGSRASTSTGSRAGRSSRGARRMMPAVDEESD